jgi:hypothetical protein
MYLVAALHLANGSTVHLHASFTRHEATRRGSCRA